jgi:hypothetical protein
MAAEYQDPDWRVVDYQAYCLDEAIIDPSTKRALHIRGPRAAHLARGSYFACLGAAQTFGRFCDRPFANLLAERLNIPVLNISHGGAGPAFFYDSEKLLSYLNDACFVVLQVMSGRSESNSIFESDGVGFYRRRSDGREMGCDQAFAELLNTQSRATVKLIVDETRQSWIASNRKLVSRIRPPKILFWFSTRTPDYAESWGRLGSLFGAFPQLVNRRMVDEVRRHCDCYVECVTKRGLPQVLRDRFTGERVTISDRWTAQPWNENWYYPSPQMHEDAANALERTCRDLLDSGAHSSPMSHASTSAGGR